MDKGSQSHQLVTEKLEILAERKKSLKTYLAVLNEKLATVFDAKESRLNLEEKIDMFHRGWKKANPIVQKRLLRRMIDCLYYTTEGIKAYYYLDAVEVEKRQFEKNKKAGDLNSSAFFNLKQNRFLPLTKTISNQTVKSASDFAIGAVDRTRTCNLPVRSREFYPLNYDCTVR